MPKAHLSLPTGEVRTIDIPAGWSLMEGARQEGIPGILAECGGGALCATCHVHVSLAWKDIVGPPADAEDALLDLAPGRDNSSRLSCQIVMSSELDGLAVRVPDQQPDY